MTAASRAAAALVTVLAMTLAGCTWTSQDIAVERLVVCVGPDEQHPAGSPVRLSLRQGGREVASASTQYGSLVALLVPRAQTAVFADGTATGGAVGFGGDSGELDPASQPAPDDATMRAAAAADPSAVNGYIGLVGPGCPPASDLHIG